MKIRRKTLIGACAALPLIALASEDPTGLSIEDLLSVSISSASRYDQLGADVPAAVTVLTARDIRNFGWRTLADALQTIPGMYITSDHGYAYVGVRGFSPTGDYNDRVLILIDGNRINDNIYDQGFIGSEFPLDLALVDRIEVVRGPGSSIYGANALFGVVNVITRRSAEVATEGSLTLGSHGERGARASFGRTDDNGLDILLSASGSATRGATQYYPEFGASSSIHADDEWIQRFFGRLRIDGWEAELIHSYRDKGVPTGAFGADFFSDASRVQDRNTLVSLRKRLTLSASLTFSGRLFLGEYRYTGQYPLIGVPLNHDLSLGQWWGGETLWDYTGLSGHRLVGGIDFQRNQKQNQFNYDTSMLMTSRRDGYRLGVFAQDEITLSAETALTLGLRHDQTDSVSTQWSPRLGLVYRPEAARTFKFNYSSAFRAANAYERYYSSGQTPNPDLRPEKIRTLEAIWEETLSPATRVTGSAYVFHLKDQIAQVADATTGMLAFVNQSPVIVRGAEVGLEHLWSNNAHLRLSWSTQWARQAGEWPANAPRHLLKANLAVPLGNAWHLGAEVFGVSQVATTDGTFPNYALNGRNGGHTIANATLRYAPDGQAWEVRLSAYNLFDRRYGDAAPPDPYAEAIFTTPRARQVYPADGRTLRLDTVFKF